MKRFQNIRLLSANKIQSAYNYFHFLMDPHSQCAILVNAPITVVWKELWENFTEENLLTKNTKIGKHNSTTIERTVTVNENSHKQKITRHDQEKTIKNEIVDGNLFGEFTYELEQNPKGQVILKLSSNIVDDNKKTWPIKAALEFELGHHKQRIEQRVKNPRKKGICC